MADEKVIGHCSECDGDLFESCRIPYADWIYQCPVCKHPNTSDELIPEEK